MGEGLSELPKQQELTRDEEKEAGEPEGFDVAVVLGGGFEPILQGESQPRLTFDSKLRVLAAAIAAARGLIKEKIVFTGGKTYGGGYSSEAEAMADYFRRKFSRIGRIIKEPPHSAYFPSIEIEAESIDTNESVRNVTENLPPDKKVLLITNQYHMARAEDLFKRQGSGLEGGLSAEDLVREQSGRHEDLIRNYLKSWDVRRKRLVESFLRAMLAIDPSGETITALARKMRGGREPLIDERE